MFSAKHLSGLLVAVISIIGILIGFWFYFKNKDESKKVIPLKVIAISLLVLEFVKHIYCIRVEGNLQFLPVSRYPLYMCSMFLWACPSAVFSKGKFSEWCKAFCFHFGLFCGGSALLVPNDVIGSSASWLPISENILPIHSFLYHSLLIIFGLWMCMAGFFKPSLKGALKSVYITFLILVINLGVNLTLGTTFSHVTKSDGHVFYFLYEALTFIPYLIVIFIVTGSVSFISWQIYRVVVYVWDLFHHSSQDNRQDVELS